MLQGRIQWFILFLLAWIYAESLPIENGYEKVQIISSQDYKKIANFTLPNGLQALLISDPYISESVGALSVEVGAWDDPEEFSGMAHFVEHLLFLGSEAYPQEEEFIRYIRERGGECNASTTRDRTVYGFSVQTEGFGGALDRFSHFFVDPLFSPSAIEREVNAVHHEFEDGVENDFFRIWRIFKETGNPEHPNRNFSCGNLISLRGIQKSDIERWFESHYQPSSMHLVLCSSLPLDRLIELTRQFFSSIPLRDKGDAFVKKMIKGPMASPCQQGSFIYAEPTFNNKILSLMWEVPKFFLREGREKGLVLLERALNRVHANALAKVLEQEGLAMQVKSEFWKVEKEHGVFKINLILTQEGMQQYEEVVLRCFQTIAAFKEDVIPEHLLSKIKPSKLETFAIKDFRSVMEIATELVDTEVFNFARIDSEESVDVAADFLQYLKPEECIYFLIAPFSEIGVAPTNLEKWMGTQYCMRKIADEKMQVWKNLLPHPLIHLNPLEEKNEQEFSLGDEGLENMIHGHIQEPLFVVDTPAVKIRLVQPSLESDKLEAFFFFDTPSVSGGIKNWAASEIFIRIMNAVLKEECKVDKNMRFELELDGRKLCLFCSMEQAFSTNCLSKIFTLMRNFSSSFLQFESAKKNFLDRYPGDPDPIDHAQKILDALISRFQFTEMELYHTIAKLSYEEYEKWEKKVFNRVSIEGAFLANLETEKALELWESISRTFPFIPYKSYDLTPKNGSFLDEKQARCFVQKTHRMGNALVLMVAGQGEYKKNGIARQMIACLLQSEFFSELRTRQQTGYKVHNWTRMVNNSICYGFSLQSTTYHPLDLLQRVEQFLDDFAEKIEEKFPCNRFEILRDSLAISWKKQRSQASKQEDRVFAERNLEGLKIISYKDLIKSMQETLRIKNRKRLAILIEGKQFPALTREEILSEGYEVLGECG